MQQELSSRAFAGIDTATVAINDYRMVSPNVAEVVVSTTGKMKPMEIAAKLVKVMNESATPIHGSFRWVKDNIAVGFVSTAAAPRLIESESELSGYRHVASNMYLDESDESLWELRNGAGGKYLARKGSDELPEVLSSVRRPRGAGVPSTASIQRPEPEANEFVCFVNSKAEIDYGFVVGKDKNQNLAVVNEACVADRAISVDPKMVVSFEQVQLPPHSKMPTLAGVPDAATMIDYYRKAYFYNGDYLKKVIETINDQAAA